MRTLEDSVVPDHVQAPHLALVLLLHTSRDMAFTKIEALEEGLRFFKNSITQHDRASKRVDLVVVTFGDDVRVISDFSGIDRFHPPTLIGSGQACVGDAILRAVGMIEKRRRAYRDCGIDCCRPWVFMITDGSPTDMQPGDEKWDQVRLIVHNGESNKKFAFFVAVPVQKKRAISHLAEIAPPNRVPMKFEWSKIEDLFQWLVKKMSF